MLSVDEQGGNNAQEQAAARAAVIIDTLKQGTEFSEIAMAESSSSSAWKAVIWDGVRQRHYQACFRRRYWI